MAGLRIISRAKSLIRAIAPECISKRLNRPKTIIKPQYFDKFASIPDVQNTKVVVQASELYGMPRLERTPFSMPTYPQKIQPSKSVKGPSLDTDSNSAVATRTNEGWIRRAINWILDKSG